MVWSKVRSARRDKAVPAPVSARTRYRKRLNMAWSAHCQQGSPTCFQNCAVRVLCEGENLRRSTITFRLPLLQGHCWHVSETHTIEARVLGGTSILFLMAHVLLHTILPPLYAAGKFVLMPSSACHSAPDCIPCLVKARLKASSSADRGNYVRTIEP